MNTPLYSVSELTLRIKDCLRANFDRVRVQGEIADFTHYQASGHMYFSLADDDARLSAVMFRRANQKLEFEPEEGMTVVAGGRLDVYEERGNYQLIVEELEPRGQGDLRREFRELKQKLEEEGALDAARKRPLPRLPMAIGVVTSADGAAFWDIVQTLRRRCRLPRVVLYPSRVNGRDAAPDLVRGIRRLPEIVDLDLLIVGRGGGSPEDLWAFNTEEVARALLDCPVPVISAVGHEVDVTIADLVADHRSPTPTAAGEEATPSREELEQSLAELNRRVSTEYRSALDRRRDSVRYLAEKPVFSDLEGLLEPFRERFERNRERIHNRYRQFLNERCHALERVRDRMDSLNPTSVLSRGFALVHREERLVTSVSQARAGDELTVRWADGEADVTVRDTRADASGDPPSDPD